MQFFIDAGAQLIQTFGRQLKWIAGLIMLMTAARRMRDRDLPELAAEQQPTGMPLVWLGRMVGVVLALAAVIFIVLNYQSLAEGMLQTISSLPGQP